MEDIEGLVTDYIQTFIKSKFIANFYILIYNGQLAMGHRHCKHAGQAFAASGRP